MEIRLAAYLQPDSIVDGEGIRTVIWTQGCPHKCPGCHNPDTHDFNGGCLIDTNEIKEELKRLKNQTGITFSGGDPMCQPEACLEIARYAKSLGMNIWCYTGYTYEELLSMKNKYIKDFLQEIDVLIDGKFILEQKSLNLRFKGSKNQRVIDVKKSLEQNQVVLKETKEEITLSKKEYIFV